MKAFPVFVPATIFCTASVTLVATHLRTIYLVNQMDSQIESINRILERSEKKRKSMDISSDEYKLLLSENRLFDSHKYFLQSQKKYGPFFHLLVVGLENDNAMCNRIMNEAKIKVRLN